jgi:hypothetical protein
MNDWSNNVQWISRCKKHRTSAAVIVGDDGRVHVLKVIGHCDVCGWKIDVNSRIVSTKTSHDCGNVADDVATTKRNWLGVFVEDYYAVGFEKTNADKNKFFEIFL